MSDTYKATLRGNTLTWLDDNPGLSLDDQEVNVLVTVLEEPKGSFETQSRGEAMAQCLEQLANTGGIQGISDPVAWQRELRKDRSIYPE